MADELFDDDDLFDEEDLASKADVAFEPKTKPDKSSICAVLWGLDDTLKSGIAMASRDKKQIKAGEVVVIFDLDDANEPIWTSHWDASKDFRIINPLIWKTGTEKKEIDYDATMNYINILVATLDNKIRKGELTVASTIFDGLDKLMESSEFQTRLEKDIEIDEGMHFAFWRRRNKYFMDILKATKSLKCPKYFITHSRTYQKKKDDKVVKEWEDGDWHKKVPNEMFQKILCTKDMSPDGTVTYSAKILKFKGRPELVNQDLVTMRVADGKATFYGLPELRDKQHVEEAKR